MMRHLLCFLLTASLAVGVAQADRVIISGGPALREWEDLRVKDDRHDRWWANFIRAATIRIDQYRKEPESDGDIIWMVYRPGYRARGEEDAKPYLTWITNLASKRGIRLQWFSSGKEFIELLNARPQRSIRRFDYFGHSNRYAFMFEYGSHILAASTAWLHESELSRIKESVFRKDAVCISWGCHTGESMSAVWEEQLKLPLIGVRGPTNYMSVGQGKLPEAKGPWTKPR